MIELYDVVNSRSGYQFFESALDEIRQNDFKLKNNYLSIDLNNFFSFTVLTLNGEFFAFSGLQKRKDNKTFGRISSRMYISKKFRSTTLSRLKGRLSAMEESVKYPGSLLMIPFQIEVARQQKLDVVFLSREYPQRINAFVAHTDLHNSLQKDCNKLTRLDDLFYVCENEGDSVSCWQRIAFLQLTNNVSNIEFRNSFRSISLEEWSEKYGKRN